MENPTRTDTEASGRVRWAHAGHETRRCRKAFRPFDSKGHLPRVVYIFGQQKSCFRSTPGPRGRIAAAVTLSDRPWVWTTSTTRLSVHRRLAPRVPSQGPLPSQPNPRRYGLPPAASLLSLPGGTHTCTGAPIHARGHPSMHQHLNVLAPQHLSVLAPQHLSGLAPQYLSGHDPNLCHHLC